MDASEDSDVFITTIENLNAKMKAINTSYEKSVKEIKAKEYFEVLTVVESNPGMSLKLIKKAIIKYYKCRIKVSADSK